MLGTMLFTDKPTDGDLGSQTKQIVKFFDLLPYFVDIRTVLALGCFNCFFQQCKNALHGFAVANDTISKFVFYIQFFAERFHFVLKFLMVVDVI